MFFAAQTQIHRCVEDNPNALGFAFIVSHQNVHPSISYIPTVSGEENCVHNRLCPLPGINDGAHSLEESFTLCGIAVLRLDNPTKSLLLSVIKVLNLPTEDPKSIKFPKSYRFSFFYTTGHGANRVFFTKDGSVSYKDVYNLYNDHSGFLEQRYFFFDNCRSIRLDNMSMYPNGDHLIPSFPEISPGNRMIFAAVSGNMAWGPKGEGVSFMTKKMIVLLKEKISLDEMLIRLRKEIAKEVRNEKGQQQQILDESATHISVHFWEEQKIASECVNAMCVHVFILLLV